jgi:hypothetical protein
MEEVLELDLPKHAIIVANTGLQPKGMGKVASSKLKEANEFLDKHPIPAWIFMSRYSLKQQEEGICIEGILQFADAQANTVTVVVTVNEYAKTNYPIHTTINTLNQLVKTYLGKTINVRIRPQISTDNQFQYELMAIN